MSRFAHRVTATSADAEQVADGNTKRATACREQQQAHAQAPQRALVHTPSGARAGAQHGSDQAAGAAGDGAPRPRGEALALCSLLRGGCGAWNAHLSGVLRLLTTSTVRLNILE